MATEIKGLDTVKMKGDDEVSKMIEAHMGSCFNTERKNNKLIDKWIEDIVGDEDGDQFENIKENLKHYTKLYNFKKFK